MHGPDAHAYHCGPTTEPDRSRTAGRGRNSAGEIERAVGRQHPNHNRETDQSPVVVTRPFAHHDARTPVPPDRWSRRQTHGLRQPARDWVAEDVCRRIRPDSSRTHARTGGRSMIPGGATVFRLNLSQNRFERSCLRQDLEALRGDRIERQGTSPAFASTTYISAPCRAGAETLRAGVAFGVSVHPRTQAVAL